jgi:2',3'-cyclic-nucleotide 2'-phosphodiesterase (5'-nucleotidase family)
MRAASLITLLATAAPAFSCDSCYGPSSDVHVRHVKRMQPDAQNATDPPAGPLAWGQINFIHTTDTHGWLEGHLKEQNYGADWGDFKSFTQHMRAKAAALKVDL